MAENSMKLLILSGAKTISFWKPDQGFRILFLHVAIWKVKIIEEVGLPIIPPMHLSTLRTWVFGQLFTVYLKTQKFKRHCSNYQNNCVKALNKELCIVHAQFLHQRLSTKTTKYKAVFSMRRLACDKNNQI